MYNRVILIGRMVADPEVSTTPTGTNVAKFRVAVNRPKQKDKEAKADFINIVAWRKLGEFAKTYFGKGKAIGIEGSIQTGDYTDRDGNKRYTFEVVADRLFFVGSKNGEKAAADPQDEGWTALDIDGEEDTPF